MELLKSALDLLKMGSIPMNTSNTVDKKLILGAHALHRALKLISIALRTVHGTSNINAQRMLHVARELLANHIVKGAVVFLLIRLVDGANLAVGRGLWRRDVVAVGREAGAGKRAVDAGAAGLVGGFFGGVAVEAAVLVEGALGGVGCGSGLGG